MTIEDTNKIDVVGINESSEAICLTITDHLGWENEQEHIQLLQDKLNAYLRFIDSGQIYEAYPEATGHHVIIRVCAQNHIPSIGIQFYKQATAFVKKEGVDIEIEVFQSESD
ncbi:MAG: DUF6572 domain-containing protein [Acidobacteriota bacterium]